MKSNIREHQILELTQEVREYKKAKDWIAAVRALAQLKVLHGKDWSDTDYAKALQQAGQFDKAIKEIDWLLAHSRQQQDDPGWAHLPQSAKEARHQKQCAEIHKAAALICKRQKRPDLEQHHRTQLAHWQGLHSAGSEQVSKDCDAAYVARGEPFKDIFESEQYQLDRRATALKKAGDWDGAIAALQKRKAIMGVQWQDDKLAKYLQAAGRFDEAMTEIQWLLDNSHAWAVASFSHQPTSTLLKQRATRRSQIHGAAALICKRAKRADLQAEHERLRDACWDLREKITPVAEADMKQRMRAWNAASHVERQALIAKREASTARNRAMGDARWLKTVFWREETHETRHGHYPSDSSDSARF